MDQENKDRDTVLLGVRRIIRYLAGADDITVEEADVEKIERDLSERFQLGFIENLGDLYAQVVIVVNEWRTK